MAVTTTLKVLRESVAKDLGLMINTFIDSGGGTTYVVNALTDEVPDAEKMRDSYLYQTGVGYRRIVNVTGGVNVTLARAATFTVPAAGQVYFLMTPTELDDAINEVLKELWLEQIDTIAIVPNTKVYALPAAIQRRGQLVSVKWRDTTSLATNPREDHMAGYHINETANSCTLIVHDQMRSPTTWDIQVMSRQMYAPMASDVATTTCPYPLLYPMSKVAIIHKIYSKFGKGMNSLFGPKMVVAEREQMKAKADWIPRVNATEYIEPELWQGIDNNPNFDSPSW